MPRHILMILLALVAACDSDSDPIDAGSVPADASVDAGTMEDASDAADSVVADAGHHEDDAGAEDGSVFNGCGELGEQACAADVRCQVVGARATDEDGGTEDTVFIACLAADNACSDGDAETCASDGTEGLRYLFPTTCVPPGWVVHDWEDCA